MATSELTQEPFAKDLSFIHEESEEEIEETMEDVTEEKEDKVSVLTSSTIQRMESLKKEINDSTQSDIFFQSPIKTLSSMNESSEERSPDDPSMEIDFAGSPPIKRRRRY
ncbi:hypothetical protein HMI55_002946 [Coelomomyces lativittatus]|nr:hypothetical protein HMI55_002946 [Coelomomyces lativittatus]